MGFAGNLTTLSLEEVFQTINRIRGTGVLRLASSEAGRDVVFQDGEIIGVAFRQGEERQAMLRRLILQGRIDAEDAAAISATVNDSTGVMDALLGRGLLSPEDCREALREQAEGELVNLCTWPYADFVFHDAGPDDPETTTLVEHFAPHALTINITSLLMESARRSDEWQRIRKDAPDDDAVLGIADGNAEALLERSRIFPESAVLPLLDGVRTVTEIVRDAVIPRIDVLEILVALRRDGLLTVFTRDDLLSHAETRMARQDFISAARLFRRALESQPDDRPTRLRLAEALAGQGENPEAAGCFSQLALGWLEEGTHEDALSAALRAVSLAPQDPQLRLILVRCLLKTGETTEAVDELNRVMLRFLELGQFEDARATGLKILDLDPGNEAVRQTMATILASAEDDQQSQDVLVCGSCGHVNEDGTALACANCAAPLRLACAGCGRTVAVSDHICIFCGADPHGGDRNRQLPASPSTAPITGRHAHRHGSGLAAAPLPPPDLIDTTAIVDLRERLVALGANAQAYERVEDWANALACWREVSQYRGNDVTLLRRIRMMEGRVNSAFIEQQLVVAHRFRRMRRFWMALKSYRRALRAMNSNDPRHPKLQRLISTTERVHLRACGIYGVSLACVLAVVVIESKPHLMALRLRGDLTTCQQQLEPLRNLPASQILANLSTLNGQIDDMDTRVEQLRRADRTALHSDLVGFRSQSEALRLEAAARLLVDAKHACDVGDAVQAETLMRTVGTLNGPENLVRDQRVIRERIVAIRASQADLERQRAKAADDLAHADELEKAGQWAIALATFRRIAALGSDQVSPAAKESAERLGAKESEFLVGWNALAETARTDLAAAVAGMETQAAAAVAWGRGDELASRRDAARRQLAAAAAEWPQVAVSSNQQVVERFIATYGNTPQAVRARERLAVLKQAEQARTALLVQYRDALANKRTEDAWQKARALITGGAPVSLPLEVSSAPAGAEVRVKGVLVGRTPCVVSLPADQTGEVVISAAGWQSIKKTSADAGADWRWQADLARQELWRLNVARPVAGLTTLAGGTVLTQAGEFAVASRRGTVLWRASLGSADDLVAADQGMSAKAPLVLDDGGMVITMPAGGVAFVSSAGAIAARWPTQLPLVGRPIAYRNDILGSTRVAIAANVLLSGPSAGTPVRLPLPAEAVAGPVVVGKDLDRLLVVATTQGRLVAVEESTRRVVWDADPRAVDISRLVALGNDQAVMVLDGSRLLCAQFDAVGMQTRWSQGFDAAVVGDPLLLGTDVWVAAGATVQQIDTATGNTTAVALPAPAITAPAGFGDVVAVGCRNGSVVVIRAGRVVWTSPFRAQPTAVACTATEVIVGCADGTIFAFAP
jgi:tetratricopeptide (TPR) repeat protein